MPCDKCGAKIAPISFSVIFGGKKVVRTYCVSCAQMFRRGDVHAAQIALINMVEADESEKMLSCPQCGTTFDRIQKSGRMGCAACYRALSPLTGKILQRLGGIRQYEPTDKQSNETPISLEEERIQKLKSELVQAVQTENYEQAAVLRDEINALTQQKSGGRA